MIKKIISLLVIALLFSCDTDNFNDTKRYFETDKDIYGIGEDIVLKVIISAEEKRSIRFYDDLSNLQIWSSLRVPCNTNSTGWCNKKMQFKRNEYSKKVEFSNYEISDDVPFIKRLTCKTEQAGDQIIFSIPELGYSSVYLKSDFTDVSRLSIHGLCVPVIPSITSSMEAYFDTKEIKLDPN